MYPKRKVEITNEIHLPLDQSSTLQVETINVISSLYSFPKETGCGSDQFRAQHLIDMLKSKYYRQNVQLQAKITKFIIIIINGSLPDVVMPYFASAPITPLIKKENGVRPIAVGCIWRGVGVQNACETIVHSVNEVIKLDQLSQHKKVMLK
jgi:hypothetical protein